MQVLIFFSRFFQVQANNWKKRSACTTADEKNEVLTQDRAEKGSISQRCHFAKSSRFFCGYTDSFIWKEKKIQALHSLNAINRRGIAKLVGQTLQQSTQMDNIIAVNSLRSMDPSFFIACPFREKYLATTKKELYKLKGLK